MCINSLLNESLHVHACQLAMDTEEQTASSYLKWRHESRRVSSPGLHSKLCLKQKHIWNPIWSPDDVPTANLSETTMTMPVKKLLKTFACCTAFSTTKPIQSFLQQCIHGWNNKHKRMSPNSLYLLVTVDKSSTGFTPIFTNYNIC